LQAALELGTKEDKQKKIRLHMERRKSISGSDKTDGINSKGTFTRHRTGVREQAQDYAGQ
jgi:hypothetical protein